MLQNFRWPGNDVFTYTINDRPYIDMYWGYHVVLSVINSIGGEFLIVAINALLVVLNFWLVIKRTQQLGSIRQFSFGMVMFVGIFATSYHFGIRPHIFSFLFLNLILLVLENYYRVRSTKLWPLPVIMLLWVNMHTIFVLGWVAFFCYFVGISIEQRKVDMNLLKWCAIGVMVCLLNHALWDVGWLETRLLAAFLLGRIPPQEERLLARLTAWTQAVRDPNVRAALLTTSLTRLRKETPGLFLVLVKEWLHPARKKMWSNGIQALVPLITSPEFDNLPPIFEILGPILKASPAALQFDIQELLIVLYKEASDETLYFIQQTINSTKSELPAIALRRMLPDLPQDFQAHLRELLRKEL